MSVLSSLTIIQILRQVCSFSPDAVLCYTVL